MNIREHLLLILLLLIAAFLRLWRIADFTQFRGDQGVAGVVIYEALQNKQIPLTGPTVSTGELPGPAYYYLIALPLILSNFNPLVPAIMFAVLGVVTVALLYYLGSRMFGRAAGFLIAALYALSPPVVEKSRNMWNPTAIPFFVMLVLLAFYKIHKEKKLSYILLSACSIGILVQLHYTNALWILWTIALWVYEYIKNKDTKKNRKFILWSLGAILAFFVPLFPFLFYEVGHQFIDVREVFTLLIRPSSAVPTTRFLLRFQYVTGRVFFPVFPLFTKPLSYIPLLFVIPPLVLRRNFWSMLFAAIVASSIVILAWYKGPFFDHYLRFLRPLPFFLVGYLISQIPRKVAPVVVGILVLIIAFFYIPKLNLGQPHVGDIERTQKVTDAIFAKSPTELFSFALISSPSYSDYHYRFFFTLRQKNPLPVTDSSYHTLYLVCEGNQCPPLPYPNVESMDSIRVFCYDRICRGDYPVVDLTLFHYLQSDVIAGATLYTYQRK